jgi:hypothetical protein
VSSAPQSLKAQLRSQLRSARPVLDDTLDLSALSWFALAPLWPQSVIEWGFPIDGTMQTGDSVVARIKEAVEANILRAGPGEPPWRSTWYWMEVPQRVFTLEQILLHDKGGVRFLRDELTKMDERLADSPRLGFPPALRRFATLVAAAESAGMLLDNQVQQALNAARVEGATACPEASRWIETAEPLARVFSGELVVALERAKRRLELFERVSRDERFLESYTPRDKLRNAFLDLLDEKANDSWALHYVGDGGMGKTMLIREITGPLAREHGLVTSRIDFDQVNSDYPSRSPGLLLLALAADLKLSEDDSVARTLTSFYNELQSVQRSVEASRRTGDQISEAALARLVRAESYFVQALLSISGNRRVVLILDTCEELARIRPNGELPDSVLKTFELLERLQSVVPSLRVVLSGRRQLAGSGFNWSGPDLRLPARGYLRRAAVEGFDKDESERFFSGYGRGKRPVPPGLRDKVRELSRIEQPGAEVERYNPFDLNLYASWVTQDEKSAATLLFAQAHLYARERIVNRVSRLIRPLLPFIARIGEFDRALLAELVTVDGTEFENILEEVTSQEWVDPVRGAQLNSTSGQADLATTWRVNRNIAQRLVRFFVDARDNGNAESAEWQDSSRRLRQLLPRMVLERPWHELTLDYVAVAIELLAQEPPQFIQWWAKVERKIVAERAWDWVKQILATARARETGVAQQLPVAPLLLATELVLRTKLSLPNPDGPSLQSDWITVGQQASGDPLLADLAYRAAAGSVAALRWYKDPMREGYLQELVDMVARVTLPPRPAGEPLFADLQLAATELGMIDNVIEVLECIEWHDVLPAPIRELIHGRSNALRRYLPKRLRVFLRMRLARLERLGGKIYDELRWASVRLSKADLERTEFADWTEPQDLRSRIALEALRLKRLLPPTKSRPPAPRVDGLLTIDADRMASAALLLETDAHFPEDPPDSLIAASIEICSRAPPTCAAHRAVPPYFQVALEARADRGRVADVLAWCDKISQSSTRSLDVQLAADRVKLAVAARWRLLEVGIAQQSRLEESTRLDDAVLIAGAKAFEPLTTAYPGRWSLAMERLQSRAVLGEPDLGSVETRHLKLDRHESALADRSANLSRPRGAASVSGLLDDKSLPRLLDGFRRLRPAEIALQLRVSSYIGLLFADNAPPYGRLAAKLAFEEAGLLTARGPAVSSPFLGGAMRLLEFAVFHFHSCGDPLGALHAQTLRALLGSQYQPDKAVRGLSELQITLRKCVDENLLPFEFETFYGEGNMLPVDADQLDPTLRPWLLRMNAAHGHWPGAGEIQTGVPRDLLNLALEHIEPEHVVPPQPESPEPLSVGTRVGIGAFRTVVSLVAVYGISLLANLTPASFLDDWFARPIDWAVTFGDTLRASVGKHVLLVLQALLLGIGSVFSSRLKTTINTIAAIVIAIGVIYLGYLGVSWLTDRVVAGVSTGLKVCLYILALALLGSLPTLLKSLRRWLEKSVRIVTEVRAIRNGKLAVRAGSFSLFQFQSGTVEIELPDGFVTASPSGDTRPYSERFNELLPALRGPQKQTWSRWLARAMGIRVNCDLIVPEKLAAAPWEALLSQASSTAKPPTEDFLRFRRTPEFSPGTWFRLLSRRTSEPFSKPVRVGLALDLPSTPELLDSWRRGLSNGELFAVEVRQSSRAETSDQPQQGEPVNVLYVLDDVREIEGGLAIQLDPGRMLFASDLVSLCRDLRLIVLQLPLRSDARRFDFDRAEAGRARVLAAQLIKAGVGAVVILPSLPEATALKCVTRIISLIAQRPARAVLPLMYAIHEVRGIVATEARKMLLEAYATKSELFHEAVTETPFDVCLYCRDQLNLSTS